MIIAIDFDGTLFTHKKDGKMFAHMDIINEAIRRKKQGDKLILWTNRENVSLKQALDLCERVGLRFDAVNNNIPDKIEELQYDPRKVYADEYWDDRMVDITNIGKHYDTIEYEAHSNICDKLGKMFSSKNKDYGDSFHKSFEEYGLLSSVIRMSDKLNRLKSFAKNDDLSVKDESIRDTLLDLANYAIMTVVELDKQSGKVEED